MGHIYNLMYLNVPERGVQLRLEVAVVVLAQDNLIGGVADALPNFAFNLRLKGGGIDVVTVIDVPERTAIVEIDVAGL